jgi:hypothetical protein
MSKVKCFCGSIKKQKKVALNFLEMIQADRGFAAVDIKPLFWPPCMTSLILTPHRG